MSGAILQCPLYAFAIRVEVSLSHPVQFFIFKFKTVIYYTSRMQCLATYVILPFTLLYIGTGIHRVFHDFRAELQEVIS